MGVGQSLLTSIIPGSSSSGSPPGTTTTTPVKQPTGAIWSVAQGPSEPLSSTPLTPLTSSTTSSSQESWLEQNKDVLIYASAVILVVYALKK